MNADVTEEVEDYESEKEVEAEGGLEDEPERDDGADDDDGGDDQQDDDGDDQQEDEQQEDDDNTQREHIWGMSSHVFQLKIIMYMRIAVTKLQHGNHRPKRKGSTIMHSQ